MSDAIGYLLDFEPEALLRRFRTSLPASAYGAVMSAISRSSERSAALGLSGGLSRKSATSLAAFAMRPSGPACVLLSLLT